MFLIKDFYLPNSVVKKWLTDGKSEDKHNTWEIERNAFFFKLIFYFCRVINI